jgi:hypothetical protein
MEKALRRCRSLRRLGPGVPNPQDRGSVLNFSC